MRSKSEKYFCKLNQVKLTKEIRLAISKKHRKHNICKHRKETKARAILKYKQKEVSRQIHSEIKYIEGTTIISIENELGLETNDIRGYFFKIAAKCVNFKTRNLTLDITNSTRIWPTALTFLCSLIQWVEMGNSGRMITPTIASNDSTNTEVNAYLNHSGFYDYVGRKKAEVPNCYASSEIVCIQREREKSQVEKREIVILELLKKYTSYSKDEIELFDSIILTETFLNVLEHGIVNVGQGWWVLGQYHREHKFISLSIADNGIGIRNTLLVGPQGGEISAREKNGEGDLIKLSLTENISGAFDAKTEIKKSAQNRGARRGNGLKRIAKACKELNIDFSILSHYGCINIDGKGVLQECLSFDERVFGGTMYSFIIPAREEKKNEY